MLNVFRRKLKVIEYNLTEIKLPDDPSYPYKLEVSRAHSEFHRAAMILQHGPDECLVLRGLSLGALQDYINENNLRTDELLNFFTLTGPEGVIERFGPRQ